MTPQQLREDWEKVAGTLLSTNDVGGIADYWLKVVESERKLAVQEYADEVIARAKEIGRLDVKELAFAVLSPDSSTLESGGADNN